MEPPAASIFWRAVADAACACTSNFPPTSPFERILIFASGRMRPFAASDAGVTFPSTAAAARRSTFTATNGLRWRFLKPRIFGMRMWMGVWPPSNHPGMPGPLRAFWPFVPRPAVLPWPALMPRPRRRTAFRAPLGAWIWCCLIPLSPARSSVPVWRVPAPSACPRCARGARPCAADRAASGCPHARRRCLDGAGRATRASSAACPSRRSPSCTAGSRACSRRHQLGVRLGLLAADLDAAHLADLLGGAERAERGHRRHDDVHRVGAAERLREDVADTCGLHDRAHRAAGDDAGALRRGPEKDLRGTEVGGHRVWDGPIDERHADDVLLRVLDALLDRVGHLVGLPETGADVAAAVADDDDRREAEAPSALHDLGHAVDLDDTLGDLQAVRIDTWHQTLTPAARTPSASAFTRPW